MGSTGSALRRDGVFGAVARLVAPADVVAGRLTTLLGIFWLTGGLWVALGLLLGVYDEGWRPGVIAAGAAAIVLGASLLLIRQQRLGTIWDVTLTLVGSVAISLVSLWAGPRGVGVTGVLFVYVTCFAAITLRRQAVTITVASAGMHLVALLVAGYDAAFGIWTFTWGPAVIAGLIVGAAFQWLRQLVLRLEEADELKTRFVATVSHELRTPLTAIIGFGETLEQGWDRLEEPDRRRFIAIIDRQAKRQLRLVEDVLTMATLLRGTVTPAPERVAVDGFVAQVVESLRFDVEVDIPQPVTARVDPSHLERILDNLLVNAHRYGSPPLIVRAEEANGEAWIHVIDHGAGIPAGLDGDLLEPFVQGDSGDRRSSRGVGLGLTVCRDLLELNDGRLIYRDTPGGGATLQITLPRG